MVSPPRLQEENRLEDEQAPRGIVETDLKSRLARRMLKEKRFAYVWERTLRRASSL